MSKLKTAQVLSIRATYAAGLATYESLSLEYDVSPGTISAVLSGRTWKHLLPSVDSAVRIEEREQHGAEQASAA